MDDIAVNDRITIPSSELRISFARSGGPGGQNVNKVETKVELRWNPAASAIFDEDERDRVLRKLAARLTAEGELIVTSSRTRDQSRNREDAMRKLGALIAKALEKPKPRKRTRPSRAAKQRRLEEKRLRARLKDFRRGSDD